MHRERPLGQHQARDRAGQGGAEERLHGQVLAMPRHVVLNVLRLDKSAFGGASMRRKELAWDDDKLLKLMAAA